MTNINETPQFEPTRKHALDWLKAYDPSCRAQRYGHKVLKEQMAKVGYNLGSAGIMVAPILGGLQYGLRGLVISSVAFAVAGIPTMRFLAQGSEYAEERKQIAIKDKENSQKLAESYDFSFLPQFKSKEANRIKGEYCSMSRGYEELKKWVTERSVNLKGRIQSGMYRGMIGGLNGLCEDIEEVLMGVNAIRYAEAELPKIEKDLGISNNVSQRTPFKNEDLEGIITNPVGNIFVKSKY